MANALQVDLVTPEASVYSGPASEVLLPAWEGELGIFPEHDALLTLLRAGTCVVTTPQGAQRFVVGRGFAEVGPERVTILTDSCVAASAVDKAKAQAELTAAEAALAEAEVETEKHRQAQIAVEHARARLDA